MTEETQKVAVTQLGVLHELPDSADHSFESHVELLSDRVRGLI